MKYSIFSEEQIAKGPETTLVYLFMDSQPIPNALAVSWYVPSHVCLRFGTIGLI